jgi:hypothetical protein
MSLSEKEKVEKCMRKNKRAFNFLIPWKPLQHEREGSQQ